MNRTGIHPGAWLLWAAGAGGVAAVTTNPFYVVPLLSACWIVYVTHRNPDSGSFGIFAAAGVAAIVVRTGLVLLGPVNSGSIAYAALEGLRLAGVLIVFGTYNSVGDPYGVLRLAPRRFNELALAAALALQIAPRTIAAAGRVREAQKMRGIDVSRLRSLPALAVPVLATGMEDAVTLAESMDARGHGRGPRTRYRAGVWGIAEWLIATAGLLGAGVFVTAAAAGTSLQTAAFPPAWPEASPFLIVAAFAPAIPALVRRP